MVRRRKNYGKAAKTLSIVVGSIYTFIGFFIILVSLIQYMSADSSSNYIEMPKHGQDSSGLYAFILFIAMFLLGIGYLMFGILYHKIKANKFRINLVLGLLLLCVGVSFILVMCSLRGAFYSTTPTYDANGRRYLPQIFSTILLFVFLIPFFSIPPYIIGKVIRKEGLLNQQL